MGANNSGLIGKVTGGAVSQYRALQIAADVVTHAADDEDFMFGISQHSAASGERVTVKTVGESLAEVNGNSANIVAGDLLECAASGILVKFTSATPHVPVATALEGATADNVLIRVRINPAQIATPA